MTDDADKDADEAPPGELGLTAPPIDPERLERAERITEAIIFAASEPVKIADLSERLPADIVAADVLERLETRYKNRGIHLMRIAGGWMFQTAPDLASALMTDAVAEPRKLTRAQIETLAIIAYHQPLTRPEIEEYRGVSLSRGVLDALLELGWVRPGRRRDAPGRPLTWVTTRDFLIHFGLSSVQDMPGLAELRALGMLDDEDRSIRDFAQGEDTLDLPDPAAAIDPDIEAAESLGGDVDPDLKDDA